MQVKIVGMGLLVQSFYALSGLHMSMQYNLVCVVFATAVPAFFEMFLILVVKCTSKKKASSKYVFRDGNAKIQRK